MKYQKKKYHQIGKSNRAIDSLFKAKNPGKRKSKKGKTYYENRKNRSDMPNMKV